VLDLSGWKSICSFQRYKICTLSFCCDSYTEAEVAPRTWSSGNQSRASKKKKPPQKKAASPKKTPPKAASPKKTPPKAAKPKNKQPSGNTPPVPSKTAKTKQPTKKQNGKITGAGATPENGAEPQAADAGAAANATKPKVAGTGKKGNNKKRPRDDDDQENADNRPSKKSKTKAIGPGKPPPNYDDRGLWPLTSLKREVDDRIKTGSKRKKPDYRSYVKVITWLKDDNKDRGAKAVAEEEEDGDEADNNNNGGIAPANGDQNENNDGPSNRDYPSWRVKDLRDEVTRRNALGRNIKTNKLKLKKDWCAALRRDDRAKDAGS